MRLLFTTVLAFAAVLATSQNSAFAVFETVLIDDFTNPPAATHSGTPGSPNSWSTRASGGMSGMVYNLSAAPNPGTDVALDRGLSSAIPSSIIAGSGQLTMSFLQTGAMTGLDWNANGYDFGNLGIVLGGLTNSMNMSAMLGITLFQDGVAVDTTMVSFAGVGTQDVVLNPVSGPTTFLGLQFENLTMNSGDFPGFASYSLGQVAATPEPATMALIGIGVLGGAIGYRRRRKDDAVSIDSEVV